MSDFSDLLNVPVAVLLGGPQDGARIRVPEEITVKVFDSKSKCRTTGCELVHGYVRLDRGTFLYDGLREV